MCSSFYAYKEDLSRRAVLILLRPESSEAVALGSGVLLELIGYLLYKGVAS